MTHLQDLGAVFAVYAGAIPPAELRRAILASVELARQHSTARYLTDCSALEGGHSVVDLYAMIAMLEEIGVEHGAREALVMPQLSAARSDVEFWETACRNRGHDVRVFPTLADARAWLASLA